MIRFVLNGKAVEINVSPDKPLLWVLRDDFALTGAKYGCGQGLCGACTVHLNGRAVRSCMVPVERVQDARVLTIEGLSGDHPVQQAWRAHDVPQCGFCQSGQIMSAVELVERKVALCPTEIATHMSGNLCRCGTYPRIIRAIDAVLDECDATD